MNFVRSTSLRGSGAFTDTCLLLVMEISPVFGYGRLVEDGFY
jgi:hypothetical protein